jgi:hypothetical protein
MTFTALAVAFLLLCAVVGLTRPESSSSTLLPALLAAAMVCAQLALLLTR